MSERPRSEKSIFLAAAEIDSPTDRRAFLDRACGGHTQLRTSIESLLAAHDGVDPLLDAPSPGLLEVAGAVIGRYRIVEPIGEGGFGVVFLAEQEEPVRRRVALKLIKPGMDTREVIARFEAERQALALMDHPSIAKVFDAGATDAGRPYFVMELVLGVPITKYCDECCLTTRDRLALFVSVCHAVQHAHQKGVIHRDIKPSNVLVAMQDGQPTVKVIDFGVAKAINQRLTEQTLVTGFAQLLGTPLYMSPEQAEMSPLEIDTRGDIYSLGVLLYELLTGFTPFDAARLKSASFDDLRRIIREEEPPLPSLRVSTLDAGVLGTVAERRRTEPRKLIQLVRGDLDWIVAKCLDKDRTRRYPTAEALAEDVCRHLRHEPIEARRPSPVDRMIRCVRRNRISMSVATAIFASLIVGTVISLKQANRAWRAEKDASRHSAAARLATRSSEERLAQAYLNESSALRESSRAGRQSESLDRVRRAAEIYRQLGTFDQNRTSLRNAAIAALAVPVDLRVEWHRSFGSPSWFVAFDKDLTRFARPHGTKGEVIVGGVGRRVATFADFTLPAIGEPAGRMYFSSTGRRLAVLYDDHRCRVWDVEQRRAEYETERLLNGNGVFCLSPGDEMLAYIDYARRIHIVALDDSRQTQSLPKECRGYEICFAPDGNRIGVLAGRRVEIWDWREGTRAAILDHDAWVRDIDFSPDGRQIAAVCDDFRLYHWDVANHKILGIATGTESEVEFSPHGNLIAARNPVEHTVLMSCPIGSTYVDSPGRVVRFDAHAERLAFSTTHRIGVWQVSQPGVFTELLHTRHQHLNGSAFSNDARVVVTGHRDGLSLWDTTRGRLLADVKCGEVWDVIHVAAWDEIVTAGARGILRWPCRIEGDTFHIGPPTALVAGSNAPFALPKKGRLVCAGGLVAAITGFNVVTLFDTSGRAQPMQLKGHANVSYLALSPDGQWLATGTWHGDDLWLWNLKTREHSVLWNERGHITASFSPDGRWLVASHGKEYRAFDTRDFRLDHSFPRDGDTDLPGPIVFTADPRIVCVRTTSAALRLWDLVAKNVLAQLRPPHDSRSVSATISCGGTHLAEVGPESVGIWNLSRLRSHLSDMELDWSSPSLPKTPETVPVSRAAVHLERDSTKVQEDSTRLH